MRSAAPLLLLLPALAAPLAGQERSVPWKLRPELRDRIADAAPDEKLPVYFVMRERLGYHSFFPRVQGMPPEQRRALVVRELRAHCARATRDLVARLGADARRGRVADVRCNWLGNLVCCEATPAAIAAAAALDDVWQVWLDVPPPLDAVEDGAALPGGAGAGDAPAAVGADAVWAMGFRGQGVVVMNADSGINVRHRALAGRLWTNPGEVPGNGIDDDRNGFVDDVHGWGFGWNNAVIEDGGGHGTQTAGVLVADGSCGGTVYGIAPEGRVMTGKLRGEASQWFAIQYALQMGAHAQTSSHSYKNDFDPPPNYRVHRDIGEITLAAGLIRTNSTSNNGGVCTFPRRSTARPFNVSVPGNVPPPYLDPAQTLWGRPAGVIGVGAYRVDTGMLDPMSPCGPSAWDLSDLLAALPSYPLIKWDPLDGDYPWHGGAELGLLKPDVLAPTGTLTPAGPGATCTISRFGGTSNATPVAMGCMMLWKSANPSLGPEDVAMILHRSADDYGTVPGKENTYGAGRIDALAGTHLALAVHRVNGRAAWEVSHRSGTPLTLELDGSPGRPALIAVGLSRTRAGFGPVESGIGAVVAEIAAGSTGASGDALRVAVPVPPVPAPTTLYTQCFVDDRGGPTGRFLSSNVVGIRLVP